MSPFAKSLERELASVCLVGSSGDVVKVPRGLLVSASPCLAGALDGCASPVLLMPDVTPKQMARLLRRLQGEVLEEAEEELSDIAWRYNIALPSSNSEVPLPLKKRQVDFTPPSSPESHASLPEFPRATPSPPPEALRNHGAPNTPTEHLGSDRATLSPPMHSPSAPSRLRLLLRRPPSCQPFPSCPTCSLGAWSPLPTRRRSTACSTSFRTSLPSCVPTLQLLPQDSGRRSAPLDPSRGIQGLHHVRGLREGDPGDEHPHAPPATPQAASGACTVLRRAEVQSDRGTNFTSEFFAKVLKELGIKQTLSTAYPESQGARQQSQCYVNIAVRTRNVGMRVCLLWCLLAEKLLMNHWVSPHLTYSLVGKQEAL
ncbi:hypothetical protein C7M84_022075 [Penaeus vannamei]|uniref:Integrase catalytic domain-containing protein n=1 Tax=Penaeus vannamei TaxID=6689 RepID=A0A3R7Q312_PENVA|nr:hypothetical protein C7M84_022075 [Penaeus vannamei]